MMEPPVHQAKRENQENLAKQESLAMMVLKETQGNKEMRGDQVNLVSQDLQVNKETLDHEVKLGLKVQEEKKVQKVMPALQVKREPEEMMDRQVPRVLRE